MTKSILRPDRRALKPLAGQKWFDTNYLILNTCLGTCFLPGKIAEPLALCVTCRTLGKNSQSNPGFNPRRSVGYPLRLHVFP